MRFNNRAEICTLRSQTYPFSTTLHFRLHLPNVEMTLDLEVNEVEVKGLTSLASVAWITDWGLKVIGNFPVPLHALVKLKSLSDRLSRESPSLIRSAALVPERRRRKPLRLYLVSMLIRSDQPLV
jgi:hypothetical protein